MTSEKRHSGVIVPMVTPLLADARIDQRGAERVTDHLVAGGCQPFVLGTTGEGASVPAPTGAELVEYVVRATAGRARIYAGVSTNVLQSAVETGRRYLDLGVDAIVVHPPGYFPLSGENLLRYFELLADELGGPFFLYNMPLTTHVSIPLDVVEVLSHHPNVVGLKDSASDLPRLEESIQRWGGRADFSHLIGSAPESAYGLGLGSDGIVPSAANLVPRLYRRLYDAATEGDLETARRMQQVTDEISELYCDRPLGESVAALKVMMDALDLCVPHMLPPLSRLHAWEEAEVRARWRNLEGSALLARESGQASEGHG